MAGGTTMIGDMSNDGLKARVDRLCQSVTHLSKQMRTILPAKTDLTTPSPAAAWWPPEFEILTSSGSQNHTRYAYFGPTQRLVIDSFGKTTIYDTRGHFITGFSQQQATGSAATFETDEGPIDLSQLPVIAAENQTDTHDPRGGQTPDDIFSTIQKLADLRAKGLVNEQDFERKKKELLDRL
jgi:hypothetical protein